MPNRDVTVGSTPKGSQHVAFVHQEGIRPQRGRSMLNDPSGSDPTPKGSQPVFAHTSYPAAAGTHDRAMAELSANAAHVLTGVAIVLINRQLQSQAKTFEQEGGFSERLHRVRSEARVRDGGK